MRAGVLVAAGIVAAEISLAQAPPEPKLTWDQSLSVQARRIRPLEPPEALPWDERIARLLREEAGDVVVTAVGDMIFNEKISDRAEPERRNLLRILREADVAYGNLEFSINEHPELQSTFYNFRVGREFAWEVAAIGINLVSLANNHALDFGTAGLLDCMKALDQSGISYAGAGRRSRRRGRPSGRRFRGGKPGSRSSPPCATGRTSTAAPIRPDRASRRSTRRRSSSRSRAEASRRWRARSRRT
jgi:hypothetical protein